MARERFHPTTFGIVRWDVDPPDEDPPDEDPPDVLPEEDPPDVPPGLLFGDVGLVALGRAGIELVRDLKVVRDDLPVGPTAESEPR